MIYLHTQIECIDQISVEGELEHKRQVEDQL